MNTPVQPAGKRFHGGFAAGDQAVSSLTNVVGNVAVASTAAPTDYGAFGVALSVLIICYAITNGLYIEPLLVKHHDSEDSLTRAVWYPALLGAPIALGSVILAPLIPAVALPIFFGLPTFLSLEGLRRFLIGTYRARIALVLDSIWLSGTLIIVAITWTTNLNPVLASSAWTLSAMAALIAGVTYLRLWRIDYHIASFIRMEKRISVPWALEHLASRGSVQILSFLIAARYGLESVASYRGCLTVLGPVTVVLGGIRLAVLPSFLRSTRGELMARAIKLSLILPAAASVVGGMLLLLPNSVGVILLGDSWPGARSLMPIVLAYRSVSSANEGPALGLRVAEVGLSSLLLRLMNVSVVLGTAVILSVMVDSSLHRMLATLVAVSVAVLPIWFFRLTRERN